MLLRKSKAQGDLEIQATPFIIAGAMHDNDPEDGGQSRQGILSTLPAIFEADLYPTTYNGQFAVKVKDHRTRRVIGWVPKKELGQFTGMTRTCRATGFLMRFRDGKLSAQIREQVPVEPNQYRAVKAWFQERGIPTPAYDHRAYTQAAEWIRAQQAQPQAVDA